MKQPKKKNRRKRIAKPIDHYARLVRRMPKPMTASATRALDDANRADR